MQLKHCKHLGLFGCDNPKCPYRGPCDGISTDEDEETCKRTGSEIYDGECCAYFEEQ